MKLLDFKLPGLARLTWNSIEAKEYWAPRIAKINNLYWELEKETLLRGLRDCNVRYLRPETYSSDLLNFATQGLHFIPIRTVKQYQGFGHYHSMVQDGSPDGMVYGVICKDVEKGLLFRQAHLQCPSDHKTIGKLLGYPECCTEHFQREFVENKYFDPVWQQALNTKDIEKIDDYTVMVKGDPRTNIMLRYFGIRLSPLMPHSFDCTACIDFIQKWIDIAFEMDSETTTDLMTLLEMPIEWNVLKGLGILHTPLFRCHFDSVPCYPKYTVRYVAKEPGYFDHATLKFPTKGMTWPYSEWSTRAVLDRLDTFVHVKTEEEATENLNIAGSMSKPKQECGCGGSCKCGGSKEIAPTE